MKIGWKNVLFSTHTKPAYMPPPQYGENMVVCGPHFQTIRNSDGSFRSVQSPHRQAYDIASLIAALPAKQKPELVIVRIDAGMENMPENLAAVDVPKLAILGDSHHLHAPIQTLVTYALRQNFDFIILDHNKQHAHWYVEAGLRNVVWIPALLLARDFLSPLSNPQKNITFIGQVGAYHPHRSRLIQYIQSTDLPLEIDSVPQQIAAKRYNNSSITLNCSLNGDFNLRVFETLASGGMLMTDRLSPLSGLYSLFREGEHFVGFDGHADFEQKARHFLAHPGERNEIARRGHKQLSRTLNMQTRTKTLHTLVNKGELNPLYKIESDLRMSAYDCRSKADLFFRIGIYEWVQEQHRQFDDITVINTADGDIRITCDLADLPLLTLLSSAAGQNRDVVEQSGLNGVIQFYAESDQLPATTGRTIIIVSASSLEQALEYYDPNAVVIADGLDLEDRQAICDRFSAAGYVFGTQKPGIAYRSKDWSGAT
jgi:hypothetical protein